MSIYIDGALQVISVIDPPAIYDNPSYVAMEPTTESLKIEKYTDVLGGSDFFDGQIDEVKIWDVALTAEQVSAEFVAGT